MKTEFEYIVIGIGALGRGTAYWLSRSSESVLGLEQYELGHVRGASHDFSRIIRLSYQSPEYVKLAQQAYQAWAVVADEANEQLVVPTGGLDLEPPGSVQPLDDYISALKHCQIEHEVLDDREIMKRWTQFKLDEGTRGLYLETGGLVAAMKGNEAHVNLARKNGATILDNTEVVDIKDHGGEIEVITGGANPQSYRCRKLIMCADAWTNKLLAKLNPEIQLPLTVTQEQVTYYNSPKTADFALGKIPCWIWMDEPQFYGFPVFGENAVKVTEDLGGKQVTVDTRTFDPDQDMLNRVEGFLQKHLPDALGPLLYSKTCLYTLPPDRDFVIDTVPYHKNVYVAVGAGHAFKLASLIGKILSELATSGKTQSHVADFKFDRPAIKEHDPATPFRYLR